MKKLILISLCLCLYLSGQAKVSKISSENSISCKKTANGLNPTDKIQQKFAFNENSDMPNHVRRSALKSVKSSVKSTQTAVIKSVTINAGGLLAALTPTELNTVTNLSIAGNIDARDFKILRDSMPLLAVLDLNAVNIQAYSGTAGTMSPLNINYSEKTIPNYAFCDSISYNSKISLTTITLPTSITSIGSTAFNGCSGLTGTLNIPSLVTNIGFSAFAYCGSLTEVNIPLSVITLGDYAFDACGGTISVDINNPNYSSSDGVLFDKQKTLLIQCPASKTGSYIIPSTVKTIGDWAFENCALTSVVIPETVTTLLIGIFYNCTSLTSVNIPSAITSIPDYTFFYCSGLLKIAIPNLVTSIGYQAFGYSGLTSVTIPNSVTSLGNSSFYNCAKLNSVTLPNSVIKIGSRAFGYCSTLTEINVGSGNPAYSSLNGVLFNKNQNKLIQFPSGKQGSYIIPNTVDSLDNYSFHRCSVLTNITIPSSVISIGNYAFYSCIGLTSIYAYPSIPVDLSFRLSVFYNINKTTCTLYVPYGTKALYAAASQWSDFTNIVEIAPVSKTISINTPGTLYSLLTSDQLKTINNLTITGLIDARDFKTMRDSMPLLTGLDLSAVSVQPYTGTDGTFSSSSTVYPINTIPDFAFHYYSDNTGKTSLTSVILPNNITTIGSSAFDGCTGLTTLSIPNSVTTIADAAFWWCASLTQINIPSTVTSIGIAVFSACSGLITVNPANPNYSSLSGVLFDKSKTTLMQCPTSISGSYTIPSTVTIVAQEAFNNCVNLTSVIMPSTLTTINDWAFNSCDGLTSLSLPSSIKTIGAQAFYYCQGLTGNLTIPSQVNSVGTYAFSFCEKLNSVSIPASLISIGNYAFYNCGGSLNVEAANPIYSSENGILFNKSKTTLIQCYSSINTSYEIPLSVTTIGSSAFSRCYNLKGITIPSSVTTISKNAFWGCSSLLSITIPETVTSIGSYAFSGCTGLKSIYSFAKTPQNLSTSSQVFYNVTNNGCTLYVPFGSKTLYQAAIQWQDFLNIWEMVSSYNVTVPVGTKACYIAGEMNNWTQQLMTKVDETHYTITINGAATSQKYKYCSGPAWMFVERTIDGKDVSNRTYSTNDIVESWASIYDPSVVLTDIKYSVTVPLGTKKCYISGDMNYWSFTAMTKTDSIHYSITLPSNLTFVYKYCSGPSWDYVEMDASGNYLPNNRNYSANDVVANWKSIYSSIVNIESEKLNIYPNPFTEGFIINGLDGYANVTITDLNGRLLLNKQVYRQESISVGNLPKGLYFVKIRSNDFSVDKRILRK